MRAMGISQIRMILSGVTLNTILSSIFSVFTFALLFYYDIRLAGVAAVLVALAILVMSSLGYLQVRYERKVLEISNNISGLMLQLIGGITKYSPELIIMGAAEGIVTGSFIFFALMFVVSLVFGRAFCGWVCPVAGLQEAFFPACSRKAKGGKGDWIKYFIWVPWISIIVLMVLRAGGLHTIDAFYQTKGGISVTDTHSYIVLYVVLALFTILALTAGKRAVCHYLCWVAPFMVIGTKLRNLFGWPALHMAASPNSCTNCKKCSENCPMSLDVNKLVQKSSMRHSECILCGTCADVCPNKVISYSIRPGK